MTIPRRSRPPTGPWAATAAYLAERRLQLKLTQQDAADLSGLSERALRDIESGGIAPRLGALTALAETLGMDLALLPRSVGSAPPPGALIIRRDGDER